MDRTKFKTEFIKNWESGYEGKFRALDVYAEWVVNTPIKANSRTKEKGVPDIYKNIDTYARLVGFKQFRDEFGLEKSFDMSSFIKTHALSVKQKSPKFYDVFTAAIDKKIKKNKNEEKQINEKLEEFFDINLPKNLPETDLSANSVFNNEVDDICRILEKVNTSVEITTPSGWVVTTK